MQRQPTRKPSPCQSISIKLKYYRFNPSSMPERPVVMDERVALQEPDGSLTFKTKKAKEGTIYKAGDQGIMIEKGVISLFEIEEPSEPCDGSGCCYG